MKLECHSLQGGYGKKVVIGGVELEILPGTVNTILGANGSGKSTLLKTVGRLLKPMGGCVLLDGKDLQNWYDSGELARHLAILPQLHETPGELTVEELVSLGRYPHCRNRLNFAAADREAVERAIAMTSLSALRDREIGSLSGGERQRARLAMTLAQEPELLLLDEPTTYLDICCQFEILDLVRHLNETRRVTVLMVLHDLNLAAACSDMLIMMKAGRIVRSGTPEEMMTPEILRDVFGIESQIITLPGGGIFCAATGSARNGN